MADRRIYRGIEEAAVTGRWEDGDHRHSVLSKALRYRFRELQDRRDFDRCRLMSVSALYGNSKTKIDSGNEFVQKTMARIVESLPYMEGIEKASQARLDRLGRLYDRMKEEYAKLKAERENSGGGR